MRVPNDSQHITIAGKNGTGKTTEAMDLLSHRSIDEMPWLFIDTKKADPVVNAMPVTAIHPVIGRPPKLPGLYIVKPTEDDLAPRGTMERLFLSCLEQTHVGIVIDEGQRFGQHNRGLRLLLTEGRALSVPVIFLTQRPMNVDTYALSECAYLQLFRLQHPHDFDRVAEFLDPERTPWDELAAAGKHHSFWWDTDADEVEMLPPCPRIDEIYQRISNRLPIYEDAVPHHRVPEGRHYV